MAAGVLRQSAHGMVIGVEHRERVCLCAMILMVDRYPYLLDRKLSSVFVWYVTRAPDSALVEQLGVGPDRLPKKLMTIALDTAVTRSFNLSLRGRVGLHAASEGGDELVGKYLSMGMLQYPMDRRLPFGYRGMIGNDGRYFYHDEASSLRQSRLLDRLR